MLRTHGQQPGHRDQLLLPAGQAPRVAFGELGDAQRVEGRPAALDHLAALDRQVHRPEGDLLEHGRCHLRELRRRVGEADADAFAEPMHRPGVDVLAVERDVAANLAADRARREAAGDQAQRRLARLGRADDADHGAIAQLEVDLEQ